MTDADFAAGTRRMEKFFRRKGVPAGTVSDLVQDSWVRWLGACQRGTLQHDGLEPLTRIANFVFLNWWGRPAKCEVTTSEFDPGAGLIQLQPEGPTGLQRRKALGAERADAGMCRDHPSRPVAPGKTACQECLGKKAQRERARRAAKREVRA